MAFVIVAAAAGPMGRGRQRKGMARVRIGDGTLRLAEIHRDEAHGVGKKKLQLTPPFLD
jgi:hypothetical protein